MAGIELDFLQNQLSKKEAQELAEIPHKLLLETAWQELTGELDSHVPHGNTERFLELRRQHSDRLINYWQYKRSVYKAALAAGRIRVGQPLTIGDEVLTVSNWGDIDERRLEMTLETEDEISKISLTADFRGEVDEFASPPTIQSQVATDPDEPSDITYKVVFGPESLKQGSPFLIGSFEREIAHWDEEGKRHITYDTRKIRCSTF